MIFELLLCMSYVNIILNGKNDFAEVPENLARFCWPIYAVR